MTQAVRSHPYTLYMGNGATPEVFTRVPEVGDIKSPSGDRDELEVTSHDSAAKEFLLGLADFGECTFPMNYVPGEAMHAAIIAAAKQDDATNYKITDDPEDPTLELDFAARVKGVPMNFPVDDAVKVDVTLRVTGDAVLTDSAS